MGGADGPDGSVGPNGPGGADGGTAPIRVALPTHLRTLAGVAAEVQVALAADAPATARALFDALESMHPRLRGTIRNHDTGERRAYMRYFAGREDLSHEPPDAALPEAVASGREVFRVVGAIAGG
jgi:hypothetical protein